MNRIVLLGPPGSGKGTQAEYLAAALKIPAISTGEIFRREMKQNTPLGQEISADMKAGRLVSDDIVDKVVKERLSQPDIKDGFVLDGYPRTLHQAVYLDEINTVDYAVNIQVRDTVVMDRIKSRRHCAVCGANFNLLTKPPRQIDKCDSCGGRLEVRADSQPAVIAERLATYHFNNDPILNYYQQHNKLIEIDGEPDIDQVWQAVRNRLQV
ncbi:MAG: adenylate kinase [Candidatus Komeilibacteria bacterium]|nr:adenylate kinase [Candidatus Komeilibacteria bacterium]